MADATCLEPMGEVFTRRWIVEWILDLVGYTDDQPLHELTLLEPSCGDGAFLLPAVDRLLAACHKQGVSPTDANAAIFGVELHAPSVETTRKAVSIRLQAEGLDLVVAERLAASWVRVGDFLLAEDIPVSDFVVGNPPYVRLEDVPPELAMQYRGRWKSMGGRADLYVGFYERGLACLREGGRLSFICADRWMRNSYGRGLRRLITDGSFGMELVVRLHDVNCFEEDVSAYPAITVLRRGEQPDGVVIEANSSFGQEHVRAATTAVTTGKGGKTFSVGTVDGWFDADVWPEGTPEELAEIADHERRLQPLEDPGRETRVGIGVATGADRIFITEDPELVEPERLLPLAMARHITDGSIVWTPKYLVNPWDRDGLVNLENFPRLRKYFESFQNDLAVRHTARKAPDRWFKTIDRVNTELTGMPKIFLADMKARMTPVIDRGGLYPHHNLYWITSSRWDIDVLAGLLLSDQAELFIRAYCVKMRGGTLRMQAQYLRRIRLPQPSSLTAGEDEGLRAAYATQDRRMATSIARGLYARGDT